MGLIHLRKGWHLLEANLSYMRAAWVEGAALRQVCEGGRTAGNTVAFAFIAELGQRVDQKLGIGMQRLGENLLCGCLFNDLPSVHDANPIRDVGMHSHIVCNQDDSIL